MFVIFVNFKKFVIYYAFLLLNIHFVTNFVFIILHFFIKNSLPRCLSFRSYKK